MDKVRCLICGREFKVINNFHLDTHGITLDEYLDKFPNTSTMSDTYYKKLTEIGRQSLINYNKSDKGRETSSQHCKQLNQDSNRQRKKNQLMWTQERRKFQSKVAKDVLYRIWHTDEFPEIRKSRIQNFRGHRREYIFLNGQLKLRLDSFLESQTVVFFLSNNLEFEHEPFRIPYFNEDHNKILGYYPDFFIPKYNLIIEVKSEDAICNEETNYIIMAKRQACIDMGYNYLFCSEKDLNHPEEFLSQIIALPVKELAGENSVNAGKS